MSNLDIFQKKTNDDYNVLIERQMMAAAPVLLLGAPLNAMKHFSDQQNCSPEYSVCVIQDEFYHRNRPVS